MWQKTSGLRKLSGKKRHSSEKPVKKCSENYEKQSGKCPSTKRKKQRRVDSGKIDFTMDSFLIVVALAACYYWCLYEINP